MQTELSTRQPADNPRSERDAALYAVLDTVLDPEIPVVSVTELGIVRFAHRAENGQVQVGVSPTYSGCPATHVIRGSIVAALRAAGFEDVTVIDVLAPPWSSDWITDSGRQKLRQYGIAPPVESVSNPRALLRPPPAIPCPRCGSTASEKLSEFGSTPCKALYRCTSCLEPFDYFKCI